MGVPSADDDADQSQNPGAVFSSIPSYGKPHAEAGAKGTALPRVNDGKVPGNGDDPANNTWFETKGHSRILLDLGESLNLARINVYSWHEGPLSPQQYELWTWDWDTPPSAETADLSQDWQEIARVNTLSLGEGGKHGSSMSGTNGKIGHSRYRLFDLPAKPSPTFRRSSGSTST